MSERTTTTTIPRMPARRPGWAAAILTVMAVSFLPACQSSPVDRVHLAFEEWNSALAATLADAKRTARMRRGDVQYELANRDGKLTPERKAELEKKLAEYEAVMESLKPITADHMRIEHSILSVREEGPRATVAVEISGKRLGISKTGELQLEPIRDGENKLIFNLVRTADGWLISKHITGMPTTTTTAPNAGRPAESVPERSPE